MVSSSPDQSQVLDTSSLIIGGVKGTGRSDSPTTVNTEKAKQSRGQNSAMSPTFPVFL